MMLSIQERLTRRDFIRGGSSTLLSAAACASAPSLFQGLAHAQSVASNSATQRVIIDTDPGVDDAFALLLAMHSKELNIEAITAVSGNVPLEITLANALRLVEIAGRKDIPVAGGASHPLVRRSVTAAYAHGENGLAGVEFPAARIQPVTEHAVDLMTRIVRNHPGEVTIVAVGPLTNVALALGADPDFPKMVKQIVLMGGSLTGGNVTPAAEFNFYVDPEAAAAVFDSGVPITMVGLNVTEQVQLNDAHVQRLEAANNPSAQALARIARSSFASMRKQGHGGGFSMHDPLAVSALLDRNILTLEDFRIEIEIAGSMTAGMSVAYKRNRMTYSAPLQSAPDTKVERIAEPNAKVASAVKPELFFDLLLSRLTASA
jgi:inosine-uridine nucleoside N-ribohydrolase